MQRNNNMRKQSLQMVGQHRNHGLHVHACFSAHASVARARCAHTAVNSCEAREPLHKQCRDMDLEMLIDDGGTRTRCLHNCVAAIHN